MSLSQQEQSSCDTNSWRCFVLIDIDRIEEYLNDITTELYDAKSILNEPDEQVLQDRHYKEFCR